MLIKQFKFGDVVKVNDSYRYVHIDDPVEVGQFKSAEDAIDALFAKEETITLELTTDE